MKKMLEKSAICLTLITLTWIATLSYAEMGGYETKKIVLGKYKTKNALTVSGTYSVPWLELQTSHITADDDLRIYVLDKKANRVLKLDSEGVLLKTITLINADFSDKSEELGDDGYISYQIQVSSDGSYIYVTEGGKENNWATFDSNGTPLKKNIDQKWIKRTCKNKFKASGGLIELDTMLNVLNKKSKTTVIKKNELISDNYNIYSLDINESPGSYVLTNKKIDGKQIWKKSIKGMALKLIGTDGDDNIYVLTNSPLEVIKINNKGVKVASIAIPNDSLFKDWKYINFSVLCDGTIYCFPSYPALWNVKDEKGNGEYYIYVFHK